MHFTAEEQAEIREKMFTEGLQLFKQYGPRRLTVDKLTKSCGIGKGTFYHFYESKEAYLLALEEYCSSHIVMMLAEALGGRRQMTTHEFFLFFRKYLQCDYDLLQFMSIEDFLWVQHHLIAPENFYTKEQMPVLERCLALMSDARKDLNKGLVMNLIKSIYAMREVRANLVEEALPDTIEFLLVQIEKYITGGE
ncbi:MAG: TetR/AcrR family transcriptional regulator [Lachnospiraceae bacterium]|nr:TetR/AcrR family transcriptional regulator [Lachnospiraceae bacterium]